MKLTLWCEKILFEGLKIIMSNIVIYDSEYGNTEKIAQAIAKSIPSVKLFRVNEVNIKDLKGIDLLVVGSPTQAGRATEDLQEFLESIPKGTLTDVKVAAFDTRFSEKDSNFVLRLIIKTFDYAASKIAKTLESAGGKPVLQPEGFIVMGKEGPLAEGELERAKLWGSKLI